MNEITIKAYAKINLSIDVLGKRPDGYHEVRMVMAQVDLFDLVQITWQEDNRNNKPLAGSGGEQTGSSGELAGSGGERSKPITVSLNTNLPYLPADARNIAYKAAEVMAEKYGGNRAGQINIKIEKSIPVAAGLGGGSADCAAVLHGMNRLWELQLDLRTLMALGAGLGADVPFCLAGQAAANEELKLSRDPLAGTCAVASGIGERVEPVTPLQAWVLLSKPPISLSTAQVYGGIKLDEIQEHPDTEELVAGLKEGNLYKISKNMTNVLENYSLKEYPVIMYTKNKIVQDGKAYKALMSGSGPTVFGLYTSKRKGTAAFSVLKKLNKETYFIKTI